MNEYDSAAVERMLRDAGWKPAPENVADLIIVNTCAVREHAEEKAMGRLITLARTYTGRPVGIIGCVAQERGQEILDKCPEIAFAIGPGEIDRIIEIAENHTTRRALLDVNRISGIGLRASLTESVIKSFVAISRGCNNFCSYCVVPYVRGELRGRPMDDVLDEIKSAVEAGVHEITLLGQNVNSYRDPDTGADFAELLRRVNEIEQLLRIRFVTNHPKNMTDGIIAAITDLPKVCEAIHLPVQSGSTRILELMNRGYTREQYLELVRKIRDKMPDVALTTDIITGFSGETEEDFADTVSLFADVGYAGAFAFRFSVRTGTAAAKMEDDVPEKEKIRRLEIIIGMIQEYAERYSQSLVGKTREVLVEGESPENRDILFGLDRGGRKILFRGDKNLRGKLVNVRITNAERWYLEGLMIDD